MMRNGLTKKNAPDFGAFFFSNAIFHAYYND